MQSFEYSDEMEDSATMCGKQKEPESEGFAYILTSEAVNVQSCRQGHCSTLKVFQAVLIWHW